MNSFIPEIPNIRSLSAGQCLEELNRLVPKSLDSISDQDKEALQGRIAALLNQALSNQITNTSDDQGNDLKNIREIAQRAKAMHLLCKDAEDALNTIVAKTQEVGHSHLTPPLDFTIITRDGPVDANSKFLKENSAYFERMFSSGLIESTRMSLELDISMKTAQFLMGCLQPPTEAQVTEFMLTSDNALVLELLKMAAFLCFDDLFTKLEPAVIDFINKHGQDVVENGGAWLYHLAIVRPIHPLTADRWLSTITPLILKNFGIPVERSRFQGFFEVSSNHLNAFFDEETRDLFKELPLVLVIKNSQDLVNFINTCQKNPKDSPLPIKLLCLLYLSPREEQGMKTIAEASNVQLSIDNVGIPPGTTFFGKEHWDKYLGKVDDIPLPGGIGKLLDSAIILENGRSTGQKWKDLFMLFLMPQTVNGVPLTMNLFVNLVADLQNRGHSPFYREIYYTVIEEYGNKPVERSHWVLMSKKEIAIRLYPFAEQKGLVEAYPRCEMPDILSAQVGIATHFIDTGERLYTEGVYTRCKESLEDWQGETLCVGNFQATGFEVVNCSQHEYIGMGALRKFFV